MSQVTKNKNYHGLRLHYTLESIQIWSENGKKEKRKNFRNDFLLFSF